MKKLLAVFGTTLALAAAQPAAAQMAIGLRAGAIISDVSVDGDIVEPDFDSSTGFVAGVYLDIPLSNGLFLQPGIGIAQKGAEESAEGVTASIELDYLEIPLLLKYAFPTTGQVGVHLMAGPAVSVETSCQATLSFEGFEASGDCDAGEDPDDRIETKSVDLGAMFGGGVSFGAGSLAVTLEAFYNLGLTDVFEEEGVTAKNRALYLTAGVSIPVGG